MAFEIDATDSKDYVAKDGDGPAACLEYDGSFELVIKSAKRNEKLSDKGNVTVSFVLVVQDNDFEGAKGSIVYHSFPITGKVASGTNAGQMNVRTLIDMCHSAGRADLAEKIIGKKFDVDGLLKDLVGPGMVTHVYARLSQEEDERTGQPKSNPKFYLTKGKARYDEARQTGGASFRSKPQARRSRVGAPANGVATAAVVATDQMAAEV